MSMSITSPSYCMRMPTLSSPNWATPSIATRSPAPGRPLMPISPVRSATSSRSAEAAAALDPAFERNVRALVDVQPADLGPSDITARLGAPWIPAADVVAFVKETMGAEIRIHHMPELASWTVEARQLGWMAAGTSEWGTERRHAGELHRRCAEQPRAADLRHHQGGRQAEKARAQCRRYRGGEGEAHKDQDGIPDLDLVRSRPDRPAGAGLQRPLQQHRAATLSTATISSSRAPLAPFLFIGTRSAASGASSRPARPTSPMPSAPARP
jgi:hypothetical protein